MTDQRDWPAEQLRDTFEAHEHLAPEALPVHTRIEELARSHKRRRRSIQTVGGVVAGAGLVAGVVAVPSLLPGGASKHEVQVQSVAAAPQVASPQTAKKTTFTKQEELDAYFAAGYDYDDAVTLAKIWHEQSAWDMTPVKVQAGKMILEGKKLPIKPSTPPVKQPGPKEVAEVDAFFQAGYSYDDAVKLSKIWNLVDPYHAKVKGGKEILAGQTLPIAP